MRAQCVGSHAQAAQCRRKSQQLVGMLQLVRIQESSADFLGFFWVCDCEQQTLLCTMDVCVCAVFYAVGTAKLRSAARGARERACLRAQL